MAIEWIYPEDHPVHGKRKNRDTLPGEDEKGSTSSDKDDIGHVETVLPHGGGGGSRRGTALNGTWAEIKVEAERSEELEHSLTLWESLKIYKASVGWAAAASMSIIMEGYDTALITSFWGLPAFQEHYGEYLPSTGGYQVTGPWQAAIGLAPTVGNFFGIFWGSYLIDKLGYRKTLMINQALMIPFIGMVTFAPNKVVLLIGEIFCGVPWGVFSTLAEAYSSEVCPLSLRGYLTTYVNLCWVIGQFISAGVLVSIQNLEGQWAYRVPFAVQWVWPPPLLLLTYLSPESPWWLVRHGKLEEAEKSVQRLASPDMKDRARDTVAMMVRTNLLEIDVGEGHTGYKDCFKGTDLRRTEISCVAWGCQQLCGLPFSGWALYFFQQAGLSTSDSYKMLLGNTAGAFCGTIGSWFLIANFGRRPIFLWGMAWLCFGQLMIGILSVVADGGNQGAKWAQAGMMLLWVFSYDFTIGPLAYCIVGEASSTRLRNKTVGLARNTYNVLGIIAGVITPYMLNPGELNWKGKTGFFWAPIALCMVIWTYYRLPEFKDRSYYELDILFERRIKAKDFKITVVEADADEMYREEAGISSN